MMRFALLTCFSASENFFSFASILLSSEASQLVRKNNFFPVLFEINQ